MGSMTKLHGLDTYVVEPPQGRQPKGIIVYIPDAFGIDFVNNKLLADAYARGGDFKVYLPDFMLGKSISTACRNQGRIFPSIFSMCLRVEQVVHVQAGSWTA